MNGFINTLLSVALSWIRALVNQLWQVLNSEDGGSLFQFLSANWLTMVIVLCVGCMLVDVFVYFFRWRPDYLWAARLRRLRRRPRASRAAAPAAQPQAARYADPTPQPAPQPAVSYAPPAQPTRTWQAVPAVEALPDDASLWDMDEPLEVDWEPDEPPAVFGAPKPEPLAYFRDVQAGFAPAIPPEQLYARPTPQPEPEMVHPGLDEETFRQNLGLDEGSAVQQTPVMRAPAFRPFTVTHEPEPERPQGAIQRFAQRAKDFMALDDEPKTIRNLQSNVDVSKAFHEPVYPQSFNRSEE